jgi:ABC-type tungstate transport system substrate-binding protein
MMTVVALVIVIFFFWGLADGSISSFNLAIWFVVLAVAVAVPLTGIRLAFHGHHFVAILVLGILAVPGLVYGLFLLLVIGSGTSWN